MTEVIELKNMECIGEDIYTINGEQTKLRTMVLYDLDTKQWNSLAERTNTASFIRMTGRQPANYTEVRVWMNNLIEGTKKAPAVTGADQYA